MSGAEGKNHTDQARTDKGDGLSEKGKDEEELQKQLDKVYQHWFLLENDDYVTALQKGNISLLPGALAC